MARKKARAEELLAHAEASSYKKRLHRGKDQKCVVEK
jgi:hypothetical protein